MLDAGFVFVYDFVYRVQVCMQLLCLYTNYVESRVIYFQ